MDGAQGSEARRGLWARYDAGELSADELDARLKEVDRAGADPAALQRALDGPVRVPRPGRRRSLALGGGVLALVVLAGGVVALGDELDGGGGGTGREPTTVTVVGNVGVAVEGPVVGGEDCSELDGYEDRFDDIDQDTPPASPALLSDPPVVPDGYAVSDEEAIQPGTDPDLSMSVSAGTPEPVDIRGRSLAGPLVVTMRAWVYESGPAAGEAGLSVLGAGVCTYDAEPYDVVDRPDVLGSTVSGVIPTTAFASWRLAERRFTVSVVAASDAAADVEAAQQLAGTVAGMELDAARTPPG